MKKILAATLALTLLGATAASAAPYGHSYGRGGDNGGAIVAGIGLLALGAILASQHHDYDRNYAYRGYGGERWDDHHGDYRDRYNERERRW